MQLRKTVWMLTALGALSVVMSGCGDDEVEGLNCTSATDCLETEVCHPTAKVCVQTCTTSNDCPSSAKTCAAVSATDTTKVCQCTTSQLCNTDRETADLVCSDLDKVCTPACASDTDCGAGRTCDTATGQCKTGGGGGDNCTFGTCASGQTCNTTTNKCEVGATCSGEAQSTCTYGQFCSAGRCADVPKPTCPNFEGKPAANFTPAGGTNNVIYNVEKLIFGGTSGCSDGVSQTVKARIYFYAKSGTLPTTKEGLNGFFYVMTDKGERNAVPLSNEYQRSSDGMSAAISVNLCTESSFTQVVLGFYFTGGNAYCATLTK